jgi:TrpR-related protein YerC/YecD
MLIRYTSAAMADEPRHSWRTNETDELLRTIVALRTTDEAARFFRDLCTLSELEALTHRWHAARLVDEGLPYHEVARQTGASTTTVTRVSQWLRHGESGYRLALDRRKRSLARTG